MKRSSAARRAIRKRGAKVVAQPCLSRQASRGASRRTGRMRLELIAAVKRPTHLLFSADRDFDREAQRLIDSPLGANVRLRPREQTQLEAVNVVKLKAPVLAGARKFGWRRKARHKGAAQAERACAADLRVRDERQSQGAQNKSEGFATRNRARSGRSRAPLREA